MASTTELVTESVADLSRKDEPPKTFRAMSTKERVNYVRELITVEPIIGAYLMAALICSTALYNLEFEKSCRANLQFNDSICDAILKGETENLTKENEKIQVLISNMHSWQLPVASFMPLLLVLFIGSYSDRHKMRKPFLVLPLCGELFAVVGCILCVLYMKEWSVEVQGVLQTVVPSFFGGQTMLVMAVFAYIADVSTLEMRTLRIGVIQIVLNICSPIGIALSGILFESLGYYGVLCLTGAIYLFAIVYGILCIKEQKRPDLASKKSFILDAFDPRHALDTFMLVLKKKPGNNRLLIVLVLFIFFVFSVVVVGEASLLYLYLQGVFSWGPLEYSYFSTVDTVVHLIGAAIGLPLFANVFKLSDATILIFTFLDKVISNIIKALAKTPTWFYVGSVASFIITITPIGIRSLATKVVSDNDLGKAQSLFGICEAMGPIVGGPLYNTAIYVNTLDTFPEAHLYVGAVLYVIACVVILWVHLKSKKESKVQDQPNNVQTTNGKTLEEFQVTHM